MQEKLRFGEQCYKKFKLQCKILPIIAEMTVHLEILVQIISNLFCSRSVKPCLSLKVNQAAIKPARNAPPPALRSQLPLL